MELADNENSLDVPSSLAAKICRKKETMRKCNLKTIECIKICTERFFNTVYMKKRQEIKEKMEKHKKKKKVF